MTTTPITPDRITELVDTLNQMFTARVPGEDWYRWYIDLPEADEASTDIAMPGELCLTDGSAFVYDPGTRRWGHVSADLYFLPGDEPAAPKATNQTCGIAFVGNVGEFTCDHYAGHKGKHRNYIAEFEWTDEPAAS